MIENFEWNDVVLTCKSWYETSGNIVTDLAVAIELNPKRSIRIKDKTDASIVADLLLCHVMPSYWERMTDSEKRKPCNLYRSEDFFREIRRLMFLFQCGFDMAVIYAVHNVFANHVTKDIIKLNKPVYGKGRRRIGSAFGGNGRLA